MGIDTMVSEGEKKIIYKDDQFIFEKRRNQDSNTTDPKQFRIELMKLGVSQETINKAASNATKKRKGGLFYEVGGNDEFLK